jgi:hypothetical protein
LAMNPFIKTGFRKFEFGAEKKCSPRLTDYGIVMS